MATLKAIRKRIGSVRNTQQITKAMKMVSAAKLRRAQEAAVAARPYAEKMTELLKNVAARVSSEAHPLLQAREEKKIQLVLFTSDRGLCGGYNANLIRAAEAFIRQNAGEKEVELTLVGRKGADHFRRRRRQYRRPLHRHSLQAGGRVGGGDRPETDRPFYQRRDRRGLYSLQPVSLGAFPGADFGKASAGGIERNQRDRGATTDGIFIRAGNRATVGESLAADYRRGDAAGAARSDGKRTWRAHDRDGFGDQQRREDDRLADPADEPSAPSVDHPRADGNRRHGGSVEIENAVIVKRVRVRETRNAETGTNHEHEHEFWRF